MADEVFRQERTPVNPSDIVAEQGQSKLDQGQAVRDAVAADVGNAPSTGNKAVEIQGNVPQQFLQAQQNVRQEAAAEEVEMNPNQAKGPRPRPRYQDQPDIRVTGSNKLEELIQAVKGSTTLYEEITLPSQGKFYDGTNGPADGKIKLRPMTGEEEQILATPRFVKQGKAINMIFNRCMSDSYDSDNFLTADRTYMLIFLRGISYTPDYDVEIKCPFTDKKFATVINLNDLYVDECPLDFSEKNLKDVLPTTGLNFTYRLSTGADEQRVQDYRERRNKGFDNLGQADDTLLYRTSLMITDLEGLTQQFEIQELLKKLPINDVAYLRNVVNDPPFGVDTTIEITSPFNMEDFEIELPLEANFFFPRLRKQTQTTQQAS
jgi:hypothetical protein